MPKAKKFIDKKKAVTFQLVHRSQQDPLVADETAPQRVLLQQESAKDKVNRVEEQHKYGIFYDDDYNYLQHLKDPKDTTVEWPEGVEDALKEKQKERETEKAKILLPSSVFASEVEEEVGMLNKAAPVYGPQLHLDPDLVAAMDDDFNYDDPENQLEDNFIQLADGIASDQEDFFDENDEDNYLSSDYDDEEEDEVSSLQSGSMKSYNEEETKTRFTNYSMTSSVIRRNEQLTLLDGRFEKMFAGYDENEIGALDCEEIEGHVPESSDILLKYADEFEKEQKREHLDKDLMSSKILEKIEEKSDNEGDEDMVYMEVPEKEKWDCETILSTYSNIYNHPKLIAEESKNTKLKVSQKTGIPLDVLNGNKLTVKALKKLNEENGDYIEHGGPKSTGVQSVISQLSTLSVRPKDETSDGRKLRKKLLREYKRERRVEKKANRVAFKEETIRQSKITINNRNNVQGNKIL